MTGHRLQAIRHKLGISSVVAVAWEAGFSCRDLQIVLGKRECSLSPRWDYGEITMKMLFDPNGDGQAILNAKTGRWDLVIDGVLRLSSLLANAAGENEVVARARALGFITPSEWTGYAADGYLDAAIQIKVLDKTLIYDNSPMDDRQEALLAAEEMSEFQDPPANYRGVIIYFVAPFMQQAP